MIPTEEEKQRIQEAQLVNPDIPLGSAEQFLLTLSSITELSARLQLWAFKMDYELVEKVKTTFPVLSTLITCRYISTGLLTTFNGIVHCLYEWLLNLQPLSLDWNQRE